MGVRVLSTAAALKGPAANKSFCQ